jgi:hypothetical protein
MPVFLKIAWALIPDELLCFTTLYILSKLSIVLSFLLSNIVATQPYYIRSVATYKRSGLLENRDV